MAELSLLNELTPAEFLVCVLAVPFGLAGLAVLFVTLMAWRAKAADVPRVK